jgi:hypothetical protein
LPCFSCSIGELCMLQYKAHHQGQQQMQSCLPTRRPLHPSAARRFTGTVQQLGAFEDDSHIYLVQESCGGGWVLQQGMASYCCGEWLCQRICTQSGAAKAGRHINAGHTVPTLPACLCCLPLALPAPLPLQEGTCTAALCARGGCWQRQASAATLWCPCCLPSPSCTPATWCTGAPLFGGAVLCVERWVCRASATPPLPQRCLTCLTAPA